MLATTPKSALPLRGSATIASSQDMSPTNALCHELPRVSKIAPKRRIHIDTFKPNNAIIVKDSVMSRPIAQLCALAVLRGVAATVAAKSVTSQEIVLLQMPAVLLQEVVVVDSVADTMAFKTTVLPSATSVVVPTTMLETARLKL